MKLTRVEIRNYRSLFVDERDRPFAIDLSDGMNVLVGPNNCGKSNVLRAVAVALDPAYPFDSAVDVPGVLPFTYPIVTLTFQAHQDSERERELLAGAAAFERQVHPVAERTLADEGLVRLEVSFVPDGQGGAQRRETLLTVNGPPSDAGPGDLLDGLRQMIRFVLISSGESLRSVLEGNFRQILHTVIREQLEERFSQAEQFRREYVERLQHDLLGPLRANIGEVVAELFPEVSGITLIPEVSGIDATLSNVEISVADAVDTPLSAKGTGVRGGVVVAMLRYLASSGQRGMVFAIEEPESFLHPAAQEDLREHLEHIAGRPDVTLLVTTHSPFIVPRGSDATVFALDKDRQGRTCLGGQAAGDKPHASLLGGLFRDEAFAGLLERAFAIPDAAKAVLLVEGLTDQRFLQLAAEKAGRPELLRDLWIQPTHGTTEMVARAILTREATGKPVAVLVDNDEPGLDAKRILASRFKKKRELFSYADVFDERYVNFAFEAEDLFPSTLIEGFIAERGRDVVQTASRRRPDADGEWHYDLSRTAKVQLAEYLAEHLTAEDVTRWIALIELIRSRLGLGEPAEVPVSDEAPVESQPPAPTEPPPDHDDVLVVAGRLDYATYLDLSAYITDPDRVFSSEVTHVAFYVDGAVQPVIPAIVARYNHIAFTDEVRGQLLATGRPADAWLAGVIERATSDGSGRAGQRWQVLLLSALPADGEPNGTIALPQPVMNTKTNVRGRPFAWTVGHRYTRLSALRREPTTTDQLESFGG
ncbi:MAG: ATP-dependent nuclease [Egibacteraceae bacterium]